MQAQLDRESFQFLESHTLLPMLLKASQTDSHILKAISNNPSLLLERDTHGRGPIVLSASANRNELLEALLRRDDCLAQSKEQGLIAAHAACQKGALEALKLLAELTRTHWNEAGKDFVPPIVSATESGHLRLVEYLDSLGYAFPDPPRPHWDMWIRKAVQTDQVDILKFAFTSSPQRTIYIKTHAPDIASQLVEEAALSLSLRCLRFLLDNNILVSDFHSLKDVKPLAKRILPQWSDEKATLRVCVALMEFVSRHLITYDDLPDGTEKRCFSTQLASGDRLDSIQFWFSSLKEEERFPPILDAISGCTLEEKAVIDWMLSQVTKEPFWATNRRHGTPLRNWLRKSTERVIFWFMRTTTELYLQRDADIEGSSILEQMLIAEQFSTLEHLLAATDALPLSAYYRPGTLAYLVAKRKVTAIEFVVKRISQLQSHDILSERVKRHSDSGRSLLTNACLDNSLPIASLLIDAGMKAVGTDDQPFIAAIAAGSHSIVDYCLHHRGVLNPEALDPESGSLLHMITHIDPNAIPRIAGIVSNLILYTTDILADIRTPIDFINTATDGEGNTILMAAAQRGRDVMVTTLLKADDFLWRLRPSIATRQATSVEERIRIYDASVPAVGLAVINGHVSVLKAFFTEVGVHAFAESDIRLALNMDQTECLDFLLDTVFPWYLPKPDAPSARAIERTQGIWNEMLNCIRWKMIEHLAVVRKLSRYLPANYHPDLTIPFKESPERWSKLYECGLVGSYLRYRNNEITLLREDETDSMPSNRINTLQRACEEGNLPMMKAMYRAGADLHRMTDNLIVLACARERADIVTWLMSKGVVPSGLAKYRLFQLAPSMQPFLANFLPNEPPQL